MIIIIIIEMADKHFFVNLCQIDIHFFVNFVNDKKMYVNLTKVDKKMFVSYFYYDNYNQ